MKNWIAAENRSVTALIGTMLVLYVVTFYPAIKALIEIWSSFDEYHFAFITIPIIFYMVCHKRHQLIQSNGKNVLFCIILSGFSLVIYVLALLTQVNTIIFLSMYFTTIGIIIGIADFQSLKALSTPLLLCLILIPIPEQLYIKITFPLQLLVSKISEMLVRGFNVPILRQGNLMVIPGKSFEVIGVCSGIKSMIVLMTLSIIIGYFTLNRTYLKTILTIASLPVAIIVNSIRITGIILLFAFCKVDLSEGNLHVLTGIAVFGIAIAILLLVEKALEHWQIELKSS